MLIVKPTYKPRWEMPGGAVEDEESPRQAAVREVFEELRLACVPGPLLALDYVSAAASSVVSAAASSVGVEGLVVVLDGGVLTEDPATLQLGGDELSAAMFVDAVELEQYLPGLQARRVVAALTARAAGRTVYLEDGYDR